MSFVTTIQGDKAIVESAVIGFLRGKGVGGGGVMLPRAAVNHGVCIKY